MNLESALETREMVSIRVEERVLLFVRRMILIQLTVQTVLASELKVGERTFE